MTGPWCEWRHDVLTLRVRVQPRASRDEVVGITDGRLKIRLTAPPVDGAANAGLVKLMARELGVPKSRVRILSGETGREKRVAIEQPRKRPGWLDTGA